MIEMSASFIESVDLQNGVFEADALEMIEKWEKVGESLLLGDLKDALLLEAANDTNILDLDARPKQVSREEVLAKRREAGTEDKFQFLFGDTLTE